MSKIGKALSNAAKAAADEYSAQRDRPAGEKYIVGHLPVRCPHCENGRFDARTALLNSQGLALLHMDWLGDTAIALICVKCSAISWFAKPPEVDV